MKAYQAFYLIYWSIFLFLIGWRSGITGSIILFCKKLFGFGRFYSVTLSGYRVRDRIGIQFGSMDDIPARDYEYASLTKLKFGVNAEIFVNKKELEDKFNPIITLTIVDGKGVWHKNFHRDYNLPKKIIIAQENVLRMEPIKLKIF
jgi:hypothetical protein